MQIVKALVEIQKTLKAPKGQYNSFGKYKYRSSEDILEAVKPLNAAHNLLLTLTDEPIFMGDWHYIKATATITDGKDSLSVSAYARESLTKKGMDESQITGTASSYARKYALNGLYLIDDTKDADTDEHQQQTGRKQSTSAKSPIESENQSMITAPQMKALQAKVNNVAKANEQEVKDVFTSALKAVGLNKASSKDLTSQEASKVIDYLTKLE